VEPCSEEQGQSGVKGIENLHSLELKWGMGFQRRENFSREEDSLVWL